MHATDIEVKVR